MLWHFISSPAYTAVPISIEMPGFARPAAVLVLLDIFVLPVCIPLKRANFFVQAVDGRFLFPALFAEVEPLYRRNVSNAVPVCWCAVKIPDVVQCNFLKTPNVRHAAQKSNP